MTKQVAVILSGCGFLDGAEIHESVLTLLHLDRMGATYQCFALDQNQMHVVDHVAQAEVEGTRNQLLEAARIARGEVQPLKTLNPDSFDALVVPGGFGVAKNLSSFATEGSSMTVDAVFLEKARAFVASQKPVGLMCIAPALAAHIFQTPVTCTIGQDQETAAVIETMGAIHQNCAVENIVIDEAHKLVTTPAYMLANRISEADAGIEKLVKTVLDWA